MPRLFKKSQRYNVARNCFVAKVILLDNTTIEFNLLPEVTGADCLEKVAQVVEIQEISYFGLQYLSKSESLRWVNRDKPLRKQLDKNCINGARDAELRFRIQYYVTNVTRLEYEITRYLYFLQLKHLILNGELHCSNDLAVKLASYALQAEFGDYDPDKHDDEFLNDYIFLPPHIGSPSVLKSLTDRASKLHMKHAGMSPAAAELMYIKLAQQLQEYGHEIFQMLDIHGSTIWLGACFIGIFVKHSNGQPNVYFKWPEVYRMKVKDKNFGIETPGETVYFKMPDNNTAQYVLQQMVNQHKFYRAEMERNPAISWMTNSKSETKKSRSIHDLRSARTDPEYGYQGEKRSTLLGKRVGKSMNEGAMQRPLLLDKYMYREASSEPRSPLDSTIEDHDPNSPVRVLSISSSGRRQHRLRDLSTSRSPDPPSGPTGEHMELSALPTSSTNHTQNPAHFSASPSPPPVETTPPNNTPATTSFVATSNGHHDSNLHDNGRDGGPRDNGAHGNLLEEVEESMDISTGQKKLPENRKNSQEKTLFGIIVQNSQNGTQASEKAGGLSHAEVVENDEKRWRRHSNHTSASSTPKNSPKVKKQKFKLGSHFRNSQSSDGGGEGTDSSQETVELSRARKKSSLTGSLDQLSESRTPPTSLKIRTFSIAEQEEQEAASGTHDRRGGQLEKRLNSGHYYNEYEQMPRKKFNSESTVGELPENIPKNRYKDILPYDDSRVKLNPANNTSRNDYINASYVNFRVNEKQYNFIVAQGPMEHTCTDFWQMVWEQRVQLILMVTTEVEDGKPKCFRYFPADDHEGGKSNYVQFEQYRVSRLFVEKGKTVISRGFQLKHIPSGEERKVTHLQYIDWPDHGIPENPQPFLNFLAEVRSLRQPSQPVLVHCSAGVGRSGVVVLVDMLMAKVDCGDALDLSNCLKELRDQRMHMVQVVGQYKFVYGAIIKYIGRARLI